MIKYNNGDRLDDAATVLLAAINRKDRRVIDILYFLTSVAGYRLTKVKTRSQRSRISVTKGG